MIQKLRTWLLAFVDRVKTPRPTSPGRRRLVLGFALLLFAVATVAAVRNLPPLPKGSGDPVLFAAIASLAAVAIVVNGAEYALSARALGGRVTLRDATRVSVLSTAANLLPIPGAAVVKTRALQRRGAGLRIAATMTVAIGIIWVAVAALLAGILVATTAHHTGVAIAVGALGVFLLPIGIFLLATQKSEISSLALVGIALAIEIASVSLTSVRFFLVLRALGFGGSLAQSATLAATAVVSSAAGIFPSGLGLREVLSSQIGPAVGMSGAVATLVAAVERIVSLAVVAVMAIVMMIADRSDLTVPTEDPTSEPSSQGATCG